MRTILWEVDAQVDFILPGGKLYVAGAEKIIPNINRLVDQARQSHVLLISSADAHQLGDPEFQQWPPHCVKGTPGAELIPEARAARLLVIPNQADFVFPSGLGAYQQVLLEKHTLDVFDNPNTENLLAHLRALKEPDTEGGLDFVVFGVVIEYCVLRAADGLLRRGHRVSIVEDAVQSLDAAKGREILDGLQTRGARLVSTDEALGRIASGIDRYAEGKLRKTAGN